MPSKFYAVVNGRVPGIYLTWAEAEKQVKGFSKALFKSFPNKEAADNFMKHSGATSSSDPPCRVGKISNHSSNQRDYENSISESRSSDNFLLGKRKADITLSRAQQAKTNSELHRIFHRIEMNCDGGSRGNPGVSGAGCIILIYNERTKKLIEKTEIRKYIGNKATNNIAEYEGLLVGLAELRLSFQRNSIETKKLKLVIRSDSNLVVNQLKGVYRCNSDKLKSRYNVAREFLDFCKQNGVDTTITHVYRENNAIADGLANEAMDQRQSWITRGDSLVKEELTTSHNSNSRNLVDESKQNHRAIEFADV